MLLQHLYNIYIYIKREFRDSLYSISRNYVYDTKRRNVFIRKIAIFPSAIYYFSLDDRIKLIQCKFSRMGRRLEEKSCHRVCIESPKSPQSPASMSARRYTRARLGNGLGNVFFLKLAAAHMHVRITKNKCKYTMPTLARLPMAKRLPTPRRAASRRVAPRRAAPREAK